ncbi:MAG: toll/interleukin-1 receptor domain-containing protein [Burkholderiales bacterium]|nr:toll/interleukin-1 receptor domain-containing protein [Burkholderiales bacterium]
MVAASIFVSYRRSDARAWASALRDELAQAFGEGEVFFDADSLHAGRWSEQIVAALDGCKALLVVIGSGWLASSDGAGRRRLDDPDDVHRREIEHALRRHGLAVLPVLVDGAPMPPAESLPSGLQALAAQQALTWSTRADHRALDRERLWAALQAATGLVPRRPRGATRSRGLAAALVGGVFGTLGLGTGFSMASMPLSTAEMVVVFGVSAAAAALAVAALARWRGPARQP